ncbi:MAG: CPBP family intramembrane metalloprotease [Mediterranea sp.]|jgi:membrane protease YdiL (CAAX protease family)|nr:CPBP family intramembrane metalloprotease [Mediterranea sp.]
MKTVIKLILVNLLVTQIVAPFLVAIPLAIYMVATTGSVDTDALSYRLLIPALILGQLFMIAYLWRCRYFSTDREAWCPVSPGLGIWAILAIFTTGMLVSELSARLPWIPDIMKQTFDILQSGWTGILAIVLIGPVMEELLFRGAITRLLLHRFRRPAAGILISALIFGVCHFNPAQMLPAFLLGILLGWVYYRTRKLSVCILMHVFNNSLSVFLSLAYPEMEEMKDFFGGYVPAYFVFLSLSAAVLALSVAKIGRTSQARQTMV